MLREGSLGAGLAEPLDLDRIEAVAISHLHADHCSGLEDLGFYSFFALGRRAKILIHPDASTRLWDGLLAAGMEFVQLRVDAPPVRKQLADYFELIALNESQPTPCGPFSLECRRTIHGVPTFALRISVGDRVLGYSADTAYDPELIDWLAAADLIVHEATSVAHTGVHTPYEKLAALPASIRSKMRLTHYPDNFDIGSSVIEALSQGRTYEV
jgi:ribonuclease BN (tRNA processing enzyme)